jgi:hypothetical protein
MATDIHAFIEYRTNNSMKWLSFTADEIILSRDYTLFCILAGVRGYAPYTFKAKGKLSFEELSIWVQDCRTLYIGEENSIEEALRWEKENDCRIYYSEIDKKSIFVDDPDWHTDTWLSLSEYEQALENYKEYTNKEPSSDYLAVLAAMKVFQNTGYETRLIIWFDN